MTRGPLPALVQRSNVRASQPGLASYLAEISSGDKSADAMHTIGQAIRHAMRSIPGNALPPMDAALKGSDEDASKPLSNSDQGRSARLQRLREEEVIGDAPCILSYLALREHHT